ncbi:MAG: MvdC/MvdD family ATP grasp protein [Flavipsychrobacter sp.]
MILIFSQTEDFSTDNVVAWLRHNNVKFVRINEDAVNLLENIKISNDGVFIKFKTEYINLDTVSAVWYRRGALYFYSNIHEFDNRGESVRQQIAKHVSSESKSLSEFIFSLLESKYVIGNPNHYNTNKLESLYIAQKMGLNIPETLVTTKSTDVKSFSKNSEGGIISKTIQSTFDIKIEDRVHSIGTVSVDDSIEADFYYSLFQKKINRFCEVRVFFIEDEYYPMAIFVDDSLTDARSLSLGGQRARLVPHRLPHDVLSKLKLVMKAKKLTTGSVDLILSKEGEYYFLEVNPVGQYDYLEFNCNYPIAQILAQKLYMHEAVI